MRESSVTAGKQFARGSLRRVVKGRCAGAASNDRPSQPRPEPSRRAPQCGSAPALKRHRPVTSGHVTRNSTTSGAQDVAIEATKGSAARCFFFFVGGALPPDGKRPAGSHVMRGRAKVCLKARAAGWYYRTESKLTGADIVIGGAVDGRVPGARCGANEISPNL